MVLYPLAADRAPTAGPGIGGRSLKSERARFLLSASLAVGDAIELFRLHPHFRVTGGWVKTTGLGAGAIVNIGDDADPDRYFSGVPVSAAGVSAMTAATGVDHKTGAAYTTVKAIIGGAATGASGTLDVVIFGHISEPDEGGATTAAPGPGPGPDPDPELGPLTLSPATAEVGTPYSGTISGRTEGSTLTLSGPGAAGLSVSGDTVTGTPTTVGAVNIIETLAKASNSPRTSSGVVTVQSAASGEIVSVAIHPDGDRLIVTFTGEPTTQEFAADPDAGGERFYHPDYPLGVRDAEGKVPKVNVSLVRGSGFTRSGGEVVPYQWEDTVYATVPQRKPGINEAGEFVAGQMLQVDEADNGDGTVTVNLWLSNVIYDDDEEISVEFDAGWRTGMPSETVTVATNTSTKEPRVAPSRFVTLSQQLVTEAEDHRIDVIAASHHPRDFGPLSNQAIAGIKLTATDGANTNEVFVTEESLSTQYGDSVYVWGVDAFGSGLFDGLSGKVTVHRTCYPWIGVAYTSGSGMVSADTEATSVDVAAPLVMWADADGTLYPKKYMVVDAVNGSTVLADIDLEDSLAAAKLGTAAATYNDAMASLRSVHGAPANAHIVLLAGTQTTGATSPSGASLADKPPIIVMGDPDDADPRTNCKLDCDTAVRGAATLRFRNLTFTNSGVPFTNNFRVFWDQCHVTVNGNAMPSGITDQMQALMWFAGCEIPVGGRFITNRSSGLFRSCQGHGLSAPTLFNNRSGAALQTGSTFDVWGITTQHMIVNNTMERQGDVGFIATVTGRSPFTGGAWKDFAIVGNLVERALSGWSARFMDWSGSAAQDGIIDGNTLLGGGFNWHNHGSSGTPQNGTDHKHMTVINNIFDRLAVKMDDQPLGGSRVWTSVEEAQKGWSIQNGVSWESNIFLNRVDSSTASNNPSWAGLHSVHVFPGAWNVDRPEIGFVDDRSHLSANPTSDATPGNYRIAEQRTTGKVGNRTHDQAGAALGATFPVGAVAAPVGGGEPDPEEELLPADERHTFAFVSAPGDNDTTTASPTNPVDVAYLFSTDETDATYSVIGSSDFVVDPTMIEGEEALNYCRLQANTMLLPGDHEFTLRGTKGMAHEDIVVRLRVDSTSKAGWIYPYYAPPVDAIPATAATITSVMDNAPDGASIVVSPGEVVAGSTESGWGSLLRPNVRDKKLYIYGYGASIRAINGTASGHQYPNTTKELIGFRITGRMPLTTDSFGRPSASNGGNVASQNTCFWLGTTNKFNDWAFRACEFTEAYSGIIQPSPGSTTNIFYTSSLIKGLVVEHCYFHGLVNDGIVPRSQEDLTIRYNYFGRAYGGRIVCTFDGVHDFGSWNKNVCEGAGGVYTDGNHADAVQISPTYTAIVDTDYQCNNIHLYRNMVYSPQDDTASTNPTRTTWSAGFVDYGRRAGPNGEMIENVFVNRNWVYHDAGGAAGLAFAATNNFVGKNNVLKRAKNAIGQIQFRIGENPIYTYTACGNVFGPETTTGRNGTDLACAE